MPGDTTIEVRLSELSQLFDPLDPAPPHEKDLSRNTDDYIVQSLEELNVPSPGVIVIYLDQASDSVLEQAAAKAIPAFFARRAQRLRWELRKLFRRGFVSLAIGLAFLITSSVMGQLASRWLGLNPCATLLREGLIIGGWVAMWRPLEIFLYDWWPILGQRRLNEQLSRTPVRIDPSLSDSSHTRH
jgi:hypothetical protein